MSETLLPCPFCNSSNVYVIKNDMDLLQVECSHCGCNSCENDNIRESIDAWNTRHSPMKDWCPFSTMELDKCQEAFNELTEKYNDLLNTRPSQWILATERMPEKDGRYLVIEDHPYPWTGVSQMLNGKFNFPIKYWQSLPTPPKEPT